MRLDHEFTVPVPAAQAWSVLLDIERIAPCLPGAAIDSVTDEGFTGRVKVKVGPITVSYAGEGRFVEKDEAAGRALIEARGKETRGAGTARATITAQLHDEGASTRVTVGTDLTITGRPAQFGRGVMVDVGGKLLGQFADCLAERLTGAGVGAGPAAGDGSTSATAAPTPPPAATPAASTAAGAADPASDGSRRPAAAEPTPIDLLGTAGGPLLKRLLPAAGVLVALLIVLLAVARRRGRR